MSFNVQQFRAQMVGDGARPNLFKCDIPSLGDLLSAGGATNVPQKFSFMCRAAQLPGSTVNQIPVNYFGRELKFAGNRTFTEWTVTIINDEDFLIRDAIEIWMSQLNSHVSNVRAPMKLSPATYQKDAIITQFSKTGTSGMTGYGSSEAGIKQYQFIGMFPIDLSPIEMDWGANDTIEEFAVTFAYQWWESIGTTDSVVGTPLPLA